MGETISTIACVVTAVTGEAEAVDPEAVVTCYSDELSSPRSATATGDAAGAFHLELGTALIYPGSFELTQTANGMESERVVV